MPSWTTLLPCVAAVASLSKWVSKSVDKSAPLGKMGKAPRDGGWKGNELGLMSWRIWVEATMKNESPPLAKRVLCSRFLWRRRNVLFQESHFCCTFGLPSHYVRSFGNELEVRRADVEKT